MLELLSPCKLNLFLHITGRRADGYHLLQTVFQLLDYGDRMRFALRRDGELRVQPALPGVAPDQHLALRAARLLQAHTGCSLGADIELDKILPMGGGLGAGSANAATTLLALNQLWQTQCSSDELAALGLRLGADVPVFVRGRSSWAEGVGEQLQPIDLPEQWYLVLKPHCSVATAQIFSAEELTRNTPPITMAAFFQGGAGNDCTAVVRSLFPEIDAALNWLHAFAPAKLTGTGACIFAAFANREAAVEVLSKVPADISGFVARGVNHSPTHRALCLL